MQRFQGSAYSAGWLNTASLWMDISSERMKNPTIHPYRVLVADDQADIRDALRLLLKRENYETQLAASPAEALAAIESA